MFEEECKALRKAYPGSMPLIALYADTKTHAYTVARRLDQSHIIVQYDNPSGVRGTTLVGAVLIDPPDPKAKVPDGLAQALMTTAQLMDVPWTSLIQVYRQGKLSPETLYDGFSWWCKGCQCKRETQPCWKCGPGVEGYHPVAGLDEPILPDVNLIRELARAKGYCIAEHGSKERDLDVVAVPWTEEAVSAEELAQYIADNMLTSNGPARIIDSSRKPHGRMAYNIQLNGFYKLIDLSITPHENDLL